MLRRNESKPKRIGGLNVGNNRKLTEGRRKTRTSLFGSALPKRESYILQRLAHIANMFKAFKKRIQQDFNEYGNQNEKNLAVRYVRMDRRGLREFKAGERLEIVNQLVKKQTERLSLPTKKEISNFLHQLGYASSYSGKTQTMFAIPMDGQDVLPKADLIPALADRYPGLPFRIAHSA